MTERVSGSAARSERGNGVSPAGKASAQHGSRAPRFERSFMPLVSGGPSRYRGTYEPQKHNCYSAGSRVVPRQYAVPMPLRMGFFCFEIKCQRHLIRGAPHCGARRRLKPLRGFTGFAYKSFRIFRAANPEGNLFLAERKPPRGLPKTDRKPCIAGQMNMCIVFKTVTYQKTIH